MNQHHQPGPSYPHQGYPPQRGGMPPHGQPGVPPAGYPGYPVPPQQQQQQPYPTSSRAAQQQQALAAQEARKRHIQDSQTAETIRGLKRGKLTSRTIPPSVQSHIPESALYGQLQKDEKALDWTLARKRAELTDGMHTRPARVKRTLRVFLSNTCANQPFQKEEQAALLAAAKGQDYVPDSDHAQASTSSSDPDQPSWTLKIEGRLLEPSFKSRAGVARAAQQTADRTGAQKFSNLVKSCVIELARDPALYPVEENFVEWHRPTPSVATQQRVEGTENPLIAAADPGLDGFEIKRRGTEPVKVKIAMYLSHTPERYHISPELGSLLDLKEETRQGVILALWSYIRDRKLVDERDRRKIQCDAALAALFKIDSIGFHHIPEVINRYLLPLQPIVLEYWVRTDVDVNKHASAYDIELELEDWSVRQRQERVLAMFDQSSDQSRQIADLDERISQAVVALQNHSSARDFLHKFSQDPLTHLETWLASQSRDLDCILGATSSVPGAGIGSGLSNEELRRADTFEGTWLEEAITGHVAMDTTRRKKELEKWSARQLMVQQQQQQQQQQQ